MSAAVSASRGGQPSTTQPIAAPWLSPKVVTRNKWPKLLWDMGLSLRSGSPRPGQGQMRRLARRATDGATRFEAALRDESCALEGLSKAGPLALSEPLL